MPESPLTTGQGGNLEQWLAANPTAAGTTGVVGDIPSTEQPAAPGGVAPLPGGYSTDVQQGKIGSTELPLSSIDAPGLAKPWTTSFDPTIDIESMSPGSAWRMGEGVDAIQRNAAAQGTLLTGGTVKDLTRWGQDYTSAEYQKIYDKLLGEYGTAYDIYKQNQSDIYNKLAGISGTGQVSAQSLAGAGGQYASRAGELGTQGANAQAAGVVGASNARSDFLGTIGNIGQDIAIGASSYGAPGAGSTFTPTSGPEFNTGVPAGGVGTALPPG